VNLAVTASISGVLSRHLGAMNPRLMRFERRSQQFPYHAMTISLFNRECAI